MIDVKVKFNNINSDLHVQVIRKNIKNVHLKVFRDLSAILSVPSSTPDEWAKEFILSKSKWLEKQIEKYKQSSGYNNLTNLKSGSSVQLLGKDVRISKKSATKNFIVMDENNITMHLKNIDDGVSSNKLFEKWWREKAFDVFENEVEKLMPIFRKYGIAQPQIVIKKMKTLWGSCSKTKNKITLNEYLLKADILCIQYVVLHELTHLLHNGHNSDFYLFLTIHMPDWKVRKKQLDTEVVQGL